MAKKKLILNEGVTRRFMKLATIKPAYVSNFLKEAEEDLGMEEEEEEMDMGAEEGDMGMEEEPMEEPPVDDEMEVEDEMGADVEGEAGGAEGMLEDFIKNALMPWAEEQGVSLEMAGEGEGAGDEEVDMEEEPMGDEMGDEEMDMGGEEGMEEEPMEEPAPEGGEEEDALANRGMYEGLNEDKIVAEVTRRVAKRLLRAAAKKK